MADDPVQQLFQKSREQYAAASRWTWLLLLAAAAFHLMLLTPYVDLKERQRDLDQRRVRLELASTNVTALAGQIDAMRDTARSRTERALVQLVDGLQQDFARLERLRWELRGAPGGTLSGLPPPGPPPGPSPLQSPVQALMPSPVQAPLRPDGPQPDLPASQLRIDDAARAALAESATRSELLDGITPFVEREIVGPRFRQLNAAWQEQVLPPAVAAIAGALRSTAQLQADFPQLADEMSALQAALRAYQEALQALTFAPPAQPRWWATVQGKGETSLELGAAVARQLREPEALAALEQQLGAAVARNVALGKEISQGLQALAVQLEAYQKQLAGMARPLGFVNLELGPSVRFFPLALAVLIAFVVLWRTTRLREVGVALHLLADPADAARLWAWLAERPFLSARGATTADGAWLGFLVQSAALALLALAWVALAFAQIAGAGLDVVGPAWANLLAAALIVLAAFGMRLWILRSVLRLMPG